MPIIGVLILFFGMIVLETVGREDLIYIKKKGFIQGIVFLTGFILSMLYHSRTAMFGMAVFAIVYLLYNFMSTQKSLFRFLFLLALPGAVLFTALYIRLASVFGNMTLLYKDVFSGRQEIWRELWGAFFRSPIAGIGSAYKLKSFEIFEVHNGMFDILVVHGVIVFILVTVMLWRAFERVYKEISVRDRDLHKTDQTGRTALAAAFAMMFTSYFENFFTVPPYSVIFMTFLLMAQSGMCKADDTEM